MSMRLLNELLPATEAVDYEVILGEKINKDLKGREFALLEYFCDNYHCTCQATKISLIELNKDTSIIGKPFAYISYDWSKKPSEITLDQECKQSVFAQDCLVMYKKLSNDPNYAERLRDKNKRFKLLCDLNELEKSQNKISVIKLGRNEYCSCGSGKKYKKCCLDK
jgi:SEC-C motif